MVEAEFPKGLHVFGPESSHVVRVVRADARARRVHQNAVARLQVLEGREAHVGQLFVLTHNFTFFRQVKNWFSHFNKRQQQKGKPPVSSFYMLRTSAPSGVRTAQFTSLDPLLLDFESEYHYLFHRVSEEAQRNPPASLAEYYAMPNIARRLLESFLSFRFPTEDNLQQQLNRATAIEEAKRARMIRFLHTHSHDGKVNEPEHDLSILSETPQILKDVLELIEKVDGSHFAEMQDVLMAAAKKR